MNLSEVDNTSSTNNIFVADDYDFSNYTKEKMILICKYQLPIISRYPKLIIELYFKSKFKKWVDSIIQNPTEELILEYLIDSIRSYKTDDDRIDLNDPVLWQKIVEPFMMDKQISKMEEFKKEKKAPISKKKTRKVRYVKI